MPQGYEGWVPLEGGLDDLTAHAIVIGAGGPSVALLILASGSLLVGAGSGADPYGLAPGPAGAVIQSDGTKPVYSQRIDCGRWS